MFSAGINWAMMNIHTVIWLHVLEECVFVLIRQLQEGNFQYLVSSNHIIILCFVLLSLNVKKKKNLMT